MIFQKDRTSKAVNSSRNNTHYKTAKQRVNSEQYIEMNLPIKFKREAKAQTRLAGRKQWQISGINEVSQYVNEKELGQNVRRKARINGAHPKRVTSV